MISSETIADRIFKILKGNGYNLELFTDEGQSTVNAEEARRFYVPSEYLMVNLDETDSRREIRVSISSGTQIEEVRAVLDQIRNLANRSIIEYTLKQYAKQITPKDFDHQAQKVRDMNTVQEAISHPWGGKKSSYQQLEDAKLIIKHTKTVNEEQRGSRSRNISAIYIESADGERYKFPSNNLAGGRAMLRHVKEGGNPYDSFGQYIIEQCNELKKLKEFKRYSEKNGLVNENTDDIVEAVKSRISNIRETLNKLKGSKNYATMKEAFTEEDADLNEEDYSDIKTKFTVNYFDENVESALPYVNKLVKEMQAIRERDNFAQENIDKLISKIESSSSVSMRPGADIKSDPENPMNNDTLKGAPMQAQLGAVMEYLATIVSGDETDLSVLLARVSDLIDNVQDRAMLTKVARALASLLSKMKAQSSESAVRDATEQYASKIAESLRTYDIDSIFS
jgi:hypothetical protein